MDGLEAIEGILETLRPLVTSHSVTNPRVTIDADRATLSALVEAQHVMNAGPSPVAAAEEHLRPRTRA